MIIPNPRNHCSISKYGVTFIMLYRYYMFGIMKVSNIIICLALISLFLIPASADVVIESTSVIDTGDKELWSPAFSPDGNSIAYVSYDSNRNQQIFTINLDGTGKKQVTNDTIKKWSVEWFEDEISFLSYDTDGLEKVFLIKPDGSGRRKLFDDKISQGRAPEDEAPFPGGASYSTVRKTVLFTSFDSMNNEKIYEVNINGTGKRQVISDEFRQWNPRWNPDGNMFVYISYDSKYIYQFFTANYDGTGKTQITFDDIKKSDPDWGPGGILYVSYETRNSIGEKIFFINPDGSGKKLLVSDGFRQRNPRWSSDGSKIVYEDITTRGNVTFKVLNLQKPAAITPVETPIPTPTRAPTPSITEILPTPIQTPTIEETPAKGALESVLYSMVLVLVIIVVVMLAILVISNILKK